MSNLTQPIDWPQDAPLYHTLAGWEFEKQLAIKRVRDHARDKKLSIMINRCGVLQDAAIGAFDMVLFFKYHGIALRLIEYRMAIIKRA